MKTLVVGGAGYIGGAVTDALIKKKIPFTVYDNLLYENQYLKPVDFIYGDIRDRERLAKILPNFTHVIWLAAIVGDAACQIKPDLTITINQEAVDWLVGNYNGRIIFTSTCSVYGKNNNKLNEFSSLNPLSLYAKTKVEAENFLKKKSNTLIFRLGTVFGVSDAYSRIRMDLVVNYMTANAITRGKLSVFGGTQWRPLIHVKDIGEIITNCLDRPASGIYNLAAMNIQIKDLAEIISQMIDCKVEYTKQKFEDQRNYHVDCLRALEDKIFKPNKLRGIQDGAKEITDLIKNNRLKYAENDVYFNERHIANLVKNGKFT